MSPCLAIISFQGDSDGAEAQVAEAAARAPAAQDNQPHSEAEGCVRLRRHLAQERLQHPPRLHTLSGEREGEGGTLNFANSCARGMSLPLPSRPPRRCMLIESNLPDYFRRRRRPTLQRQVFLLQRQQQAQRRGLPVSYRVSSSKFPFAIFINALQQLFLLC